VNGNGQWAVCSGQRGIVVLKLSSGFLKLLARQRCIDHVIASGIHALSDGEGKCWTFHSAFTSRPHHILS
jgi:hypothetical protein